jgi:hypothetical protein
MHQEVDTQQTDAPAERIPSDGEESDVERYDVRIPIYEQTAKH